MSFVYVGGWTTTATMAGDPDVAHRSLTSANQQANRKHRAPGWAGILYAENLRV